MLPLATVLATVKVPRRSGEACELGALGGTRTPNLLIRSQMLYPLSYERRACLDSVRRPGSLLVAVGPARRGSAVGSHLSWCFDLVGPRLISVSPAAHPSCVSHSWHFSGAVNKSAAPGQVLWQACWKRRELIFAVLAARRR
jgi:hypothetical protein